MFCIGFPSDSGDEIIKSIGHTGKVSFGAKVYWIEKNNPLYDKKSVFEYLKLEQSCKKDCKITDQKVFGYRFHFLKIYRTSI